MKSSEVVQSELDPKWSVRMYYNGYFYFMTVDKTERAIEVRRVPIGVRKELGPRAREFMENAS